MFARFLSKPFAPSACLRVEPLEDRLTPNNRFVVPYPTTADGITTFHTLADALVSPGKGSVVQIEPFSNPGPLSNANVDAIGATGVTIRGAAGFAPSELPLIQTADALSVDAVEFGLTFLNVHLLIDHTLTITTRAAIRNSHVVVGATGGNGIVLQGTTGAILQGNTVVNNGVANAFHVLRVNPAANSVNLIDGNTLINTIGTGNLLYYSASAVFPPPVVTADVVAHNTFIGSDVLEPQVTVGARLMSVDQTVNGLTVRNNTFRDNSATNPALQIVSCLNTQVLNNVFDLTYDANTSGTALLIAGNSVWGASATVQGNSFSTSAAGRAIDLAVGSATVMDIKLERNTFLENRVGVRITATSLTAQVGDIDLGGGVLGSLGGNNFRGFRTTADAFTGAIVVDGGAFNISGASINARHNLFGVADPETVIRDTADDSTEANVLATSNLTGNSAFVQALYTRFLKRVGDVANLTDAGAWVNAMNTGTSAPTVANGIARSAEALGYVVDDLYRSTLGRDADPVGRQHHVALMQSGWTIETVQIGLLAGAEYKVRFPGDAAYVASLYSSVLGRSPQGGIAAWVDLLPTLGRSGVAAGFVLSQEYRTREVTKLYFDMLKRTDATAPTPQDINAWVSTGYDLLTIRTLIAGSGEYYQYG